ncbi:MAG: MBL fold metallo-hydrolase [Rhodobacter sp.]|nr:MBL fold metallo-hydrolase [Rhodobacter sp.]
MADSDPVPGAVEWLEPGLRRVLAPNPSPMTYHGTNTYLVGDGAVAVIDPGPASRSHMAAILDALAPGERVSHIFVTHSHLDHSPLAGPLAEATGAAIHAFGDSRAGRSAVMEDLARAGLSGGVEGVDADFSPHERLRDGTIVEANGWALQALWTPGHFGNHLAFAWRDVVFTGDQILGWASTMISPPDGDLGAFMASTEALADRNTRIFYPGHGAPVPDPSARANWLLDHRRRREAEIADRLSTQGITIAALTCDVYADIPAALLPAAKRNVFAHLIDMVQRKLACADPHLAADARYYRA